MCKFIETDCGLRIPVDLYGKFGIHTFFPKNILPFKDAKKFVRSLKIKNYRAWRKYIDSKKKPRNIPASPQYTYKNKWMGWGDFLGTKAYGWKKNTSFVTFKESQKFIIKIGIKNFREWVSWCKKGAKPKNIPFQPSTVYKDEWKGWKDFLGTNR